MSDHEMVSRHLWSNLDPNQVLNIMSTEASCEISPDFAGFVMIYRNLAELIPLHYTVVDLGCAYAPQSWYFRNHHRYIGVDFSAKFRFSQQNSTHYDMKISNFISENIDSLDLRTTFAICSYVPPWRGDNLAMTRASFQNCFTFYPCGEGRFDE